MQQTVTPATPSAADPVQAAKALTDHIKASRETLERDRKIPDALLEQMVAANLFQLCMPRTVGGPQHHPLIAFEAVEALARADGSVGWCASIASSVALVVGAWLEPAVVEKMFGKPPDARIAGSVRAEGIATKASGGYRVSGRWDFASGVEHANWMYCSCKLHDADGAPILSGGSPIARTLMVPRSQATRIDTWDTAGMRGTGSHDFEVNDVFVPDNRTLSAAEPPVAAGLTYHPRLARISGWTPTAGVALGIAAGALDALSDLGIRQTTMNTASLRNRADVQAAAGRAAAILGGARSFLTQSVQNAFDAVQAHEADTGAPEPGPAVAQARLSITHGMHEAVRCVDIVFHAAGTLSVYKRNFIERCFRDVHVACQHAAAMPVHFQTAGKSVLGIELDEPGW